jgi:hypothetical protein
MGAKPDWRTWNGPVICDRMANFALDLFKKRVGPIDDKGLIRYLPDILSHCTQQAKSILS